MRRNDMGQSSPTIANEGSVWDGWFAGAGRRPCWMDVIVKGNLWVGGQRGCAQSSVDAGKWGLGTVSWGRGKVTFRKGR